MVKVVYIGEEDNEFLGLKKGDVIWVDRLKNGGYIYEDKFGVKLYVESWEVEELTESPLEWCRRMQDEAETGEDAWNYYKLAEMWMEREKRG